MPIACCCLVLVQLDSTADGLTVRMAFVVQAHMQAAAGQMAKHLPAAKLRQFWLACCHLWPGICLPGLDTELVWGGMWLEASLESEVVS